MSKVRFKALETLFDRKAKFIEISKDNVADYYGKNVFGDKAMKNHLQSDAYKSVMKSIDDGTRIERDVADQVASAMKEWSTNKGVTHYTHWFQPLTGSTAEKHDAFFEPIEDGGAIERFRGEMLVQQEPDASSFPNGGIRNTFEARGYTAWDPSSPAFVIGTTLCIPTIFIAYTGEALDNKMPLLKALNAIDKAATEVCQYFDKNVNKVQATLGWEQEYFLIDTALFNARPDLAMTGRAMFGHTPAKGQQLDDHYFGTIPERVTSFMRDFERQSLELGIPVKTRHNEVAPNQFECAPVFEEANLAVDHNLLLMDVMEKVATNHNFKLILHEKPFAGLNGSGKHNNWSLSTNTGVNLLQPGKNPKSNIRFLTFLVNTIKAIYDNADLLRASIASASNDHRLGANEAPPAIMSVFIGSQLTEMLDKLDKSVKSGIMTPEEKTALKLDIGKIPELMFDNTDRNRTSPFAFTGNKFEFRAVGSTANCATPMIVLNTIMAKQLKEFKKTVDTRINKGEKKDMAILKELQKLIKESKAIRFEGNGYGDEWVKEAEKRGLSNFKDTPRALAVLAKKSTEYLYSEMGIFTPKELEARHEIDLETYTLKIQIEARMIEDMAKNHVIPTALLYQNRLIDNVRGLKDIFEDKEYKELASTQLDLIKDISVRVSELKNNLELMLAERKKTNSIEDAEKKAIAYCDNVKSYFEIISYNINKLESTVDDELWPFPKLRELLFTK
jgi:glutamine synthetase